MKIIVNRTEITIFSGARVSDVIRQYYAHHKKAIPEVMPEVMEQYGTPLSPDGRLLKNSKITINLKKETK